jgi:integrase
VSRGPTGPLTGREVEKLIVAATGTRNPQRDRCLLLLAFWHRFRVSELCGLKLDQVDQRPALSCAPLKRGPSLRMFVFLDIMQEAEELRVLARWRVHTLKEAAER